jgi:hypothetical protein
MSGPRDSAFATVLPEQRAKRCVVARRARVRIAAVSLVRHIGYWTRRSRVKSQV